MGFLGFVTKASDIVPTLSIFTRALWISRAIFFATVVDRVASSSPRAVVSFFRIGTPSFGVIASPGHRPAIAKSRQSTAVAQIWSVVDVVEVVEPRKIVDVTLEPGASVVVVVVVVHRTRSSDRGRCSTALCALRFQPLSRSYCEVFRLSR